MLETQYHEQKLSQGVGARIDAAAPMNPTLAGQCAQLEDRTRSLMQAMIEFEDVTARLIGRDAPGTGAGSAGNLKEAPPVNLRLGQSLQDLASIEGWLRTQIKRLDAAI